MLPLSVLKIGEINTIKKVGGSIQTRLFLEKLGFVPGAHIKLITKVNGNVIVNIKESRVAISSEMATKILV